jgi:uncharacterized protein
LRIVIGQGCGWGAGARLALSRTRGGGVGGGAAVERPLDDGGQAGGTGSRVARFGLDWAMQMIERPWGVTAYGTASVKAAPDLVRLRFHVARLEQAPAQAFAAAAEAVGAVRRAIRARGVPDAAVQRSRLSLRSRWGSNGGERKFLGYQCQAWFCVESRDLDDVQQLLEGIVAAGTNEIEGVDFDVAGKPGLRAEARRAAVAAARRKAELYAGEAGVRLGAVVHIEDEDPEQVRAGYRGHSSAAMGASEEDLAPGHVVVWAAVTLGFAIAHD